MPFEVTVPPAVEPVSIAQFKRQSRLYSDITEEDELLIAYLRAARSMIEAETGQACVEQTGIAHFKRFPNYCDPRPRELELPLSPALSVTSVEYRNEDGDWTAFDAANWELANARMPASIALKPAASWPSDLYSSAAERVRVTYVAGRDDAAKVPPMLIQAILLQAAHFYDSRTPISDRIFYNMTRSVEALISLERVLLYV